MNLLSEIINSVGGGQGEYRIFDGGGYFQGIKRIKSFEKKLIVLETKKGGTLFIKGEDLCLSKLVEGDVGVCGFITSFERCKNA